MQIYKNIKEKYSIQIPATWHNTNPNDLCFTGGGEPSFVNVSFVCPDNFIPKTPDESIFPSSIIQMQIVASDLTRQNADIKKTINPNVFSSTR